MNGGIIYKLMTLAEWEAAQANGAYRGSEHDMHDGFIHFSTATQLPGTAQKYFSGVSDLMLLAVDVAALAGPSTPQGKDETQSLTLRWEPSRGGDLFPHLYSELPVSAVVCATPVALDQNGAPLLPNDLS